MNATVDATLMTPIDPFQNLLATALFDCFGERTRSISNARAPSAGATAELCTGSMTPVQGARAHLRLEEASIVRSMSLTQTVE
jgi:hypothetical protein